MNANPILPPYLSLRPDAATIRIGMTESIKSAPPSTSRKQSIMAADVKAAIVITVDAFIRLLINARIAMTVSAPIMLTAMNPWAAPSEILNLSTDKSCNTGTIIASGIAASPRSVHPSATGCFT